MNDNKKTVKVIHMAPLGSGGISKLTVTIKIYGKTNDTGRNQR